MHYVFKDHKVTLSVIHRRVPGGHAPYFLTYLEYFLFIIFNQASKLIIIVKMLNKRLLNKMHHLIHPVAPTTLLSLLFT